MRSIVYYGPLPIFAVTGNHASKRFMGESKVEFSQ